MSKSKSVRTKGKLQLSKYFQELSKGDIVSVVRDLSVRANFPESLQGRTGIVEEKKGKVYIVKIKDKNKEKIYLIEPIHLKKIKHLKKNDKKQ
jgi:ribosomal protein L21E